MRLTTACPSYYQVKLLNELPYIITISLRKQLVTKLQEDLSTTITIRLPELQTDDLTIQ